MRSEEELLDAFDASTKENPVSLQAMETELLSKALRKRNRNTRLGKAGFYVSPDIQGYTCPVTNKWIDGKRDHRENLKRTGCRLLEPGEKENFVKEKPRELERHSDRAADFLSDRIAERWDAPAI